MTPEQLIKLVQLKDIIISSQQAKLYIDDKYSDLLQRITTLSTTLNTLIGTGDTTAAIDTFNEIVAFLDGIEGTTLEAMMTTINTNIAAAGNLAKAIVGYGNCNSSGITAAKTVAIANYTPTNGGSIKVVMAYKNTAEGVTLNINNTGAKQLYYDGAAVSASNTWEDLETVEIYYDGTRYYANNVAGGGTFATGEKVKEVSIDTTLTANSDALAKSGIVYAAIAAVTELANAKYTKPSGGIPKSDLSTTVQESLNAADTAYQKPSGGIPETDLSDTVQESLATADNSTDGITRLEEDVTRELDSYKLPLLCGQPMILFGAGTPQDAIVPDNWIQFADGGYDWNGSPSALGQVYIDTTAAANGRYTAVRNGDLLKWVNF